MASSALPGIGRRATFVGMLGLSMVLLSGCVSWDVHDLELDPVRVVEENCVVPELVCVLLRTALDLGAGLADPARALVDRRARDRLERQVVEPDVVPVVRLAGSRRR